MSKRLSYEIVKAISDGKLRKSCLVKDNFGQFYFAKTVANDPDVDIKLLSSEIERSFTHHLNLTHPKINRAIRKVHLKRNPYFLYNYLNPENFKSVTLDEIKNNELNFLIQLCFVLDFIHMQGFVHCDVKMDNVMVSKKNRFSVMLNDFDFLCHIGYKYDRLIIGAPEHIAPEIYTNSEITPLVDSYALGFALKQLFKGTKFHDTDLQKKILSFSKVLLSQNPGDRPYYLLDALLQFELIDAERYSELQKSLLVSILLHNLKSTKSKSENTVLKIIEKSKVIGIHEDMIDDLAELKKNNKRLFFDTVRMLILNSELSRKSEYWHMKFSDSILDDFYDAFPKHQILTLDSSDLTSYRSVEKYLDRIDELIRSMENCKAYYYYRKINESVLKDNVKLQLRYYTLGAVILRNLNYQEQALEYYEKIIALDPADYEKIHRFLQLLFQLGEYKKADAIVQEYLDKESEIDNMEFIQRVYRHKSWILYASGKKEEANEFVNSCLEAAKKEKINKSIIQCYYLSALYSWQEGKFDESLKILDKAYKLIQEKNLENSSFSVMFLLATVYMQRGFFKKSLQVCDKAVQVATETDNQADQSRVSLIKSTNYINLFIYTKGEFWLNKAVHYNHFHFNSLDLFAYLYGQAYYNLIKSDFVQSKNIAIKALTICDSHIPQVNQIYLKTILCKLNFFQGNYKECKKYTNLIVDAEFNIGHKPVKVEVQIFDLLNEFLNNKQDLDTEQYMQYIHELKKSSTGYSYMYTVLVGFLLNVIDDIDDVSVDSFKKNDSTLVECIHLIAEASRSKDDKRITNMKKVYSKLVESSQTFLVYLCSLYIARYYISSKHDKLAYSYYNNAKKIAEDIGNDQMIELVDHEMSQYQDLFDVDNHFLKVFHDISDIFKNFHTTDNPFQKILSYVLDQTGAERAVLFLKNRENNDLYVKDYLNCDQQSLVDITDYSTNVLHEVIESNKPQIIDDAQSNKDLNIYESIVRYNIQSLICFPLEKDGEVFGAIYVDHHVLSKIFSQEEITYVKTISQFISFLISISLDQKELHSIKYISKSAEDSNFLTCSPQVLDMLRYIPDIAHSSNPVLIIGESGTGKELLAEMIHQQSQRSNKPLVKLNITTVPKDLFESELFGIEDKVASTVQGRMGKFEAADGGTLFLDEIGDLELSLQPKILTAIEKGYFHRVGSIKMIYTDIRFIYATNRNLLELVDEKKFREDLYYRISNFRLHIAPLRERPEDIELLIDHFRKHNSAQKVITFSRNALDMLYAYAWPGNVRQLEHTVDSLAWLTKSKMIQPEDLPDEIKEAVFNLGSKRKLSEAEEKKLMQDALKKTNGNKSKAAHLLGWPLSTFIYKMKKYGIE